MTDRRDDVRWRAIGTFALLLAFLGGPAGPAVADAGHGPELVEEEPMPPDEPRDHASERAPVQLKLRAPAETALGAEIRLEAILLDAKGAPIFDAPITFLTFVSWGEEIGGEMALGAARTDERGTAILVTNLRRAGDMELAARFAGDERHRPSETETAIAVTGDVQLYTPDVGIRVPGFGIGWLLVLVAAVWGLYLVVARQVVAIARAGAAPRGAGPAASSAEITSRRRFLSRFLVPTGLTAGVVGLGSGLLALIYRSPRTHWNVETSDVHAGARHRLTPVAHVGLEYPHGEVPPLLDREVSFSEDVLPILLAKGGPHTHPSKYSPPPHGVRLDSYETIMGLEAGEEHAEEEHAEEEHAEEEHAEEETGHGHQLVVPGKPEESMLVMMLVDHAHRMPPAVPLLDDDIRVIASWVAQGAKNN